MEVTCLNGENNSHLFETRNQVNLANTHKASKPAAIMWSKKTVKTLVYCLFLIASANSKLAFGTTSRDESSAMGERGVTSDASPKQRQQLDWEFGRVLDQMLASGKQLQQEQEQQSLVEQQKQLVHEREPANQAATTTAYEQVLAPNSASLLFETIPKPSARSSPQLVWSTQLMPNSDIIHPIGRRINRLPRINPLQGNTLDGASDQLNAIESLNSLLEDENLSRLGRAYKPKTMSTARGFGKRSYSSPNWFGGANFN